MSTEHQQYSTVMPGRVGCGSPAATPFNNSWQTCKAARRRAHLRWDLGLLFRMAANDRLLVATEIFDTHMAAPNQLQHRPQIKVTAMLAVPEGDITEAGLRWNIDVGIQYLDAWMRGNGCVPIYNLMEDAATAEICRAQVWQWVKHGARLNDGRPVTADLVKRTIVDVAEGLRGSIRGEQLAHAARTYEQMMTSGDFPEFLRRRLRLYRLRG